MTTKRDGDDAALKPGPALIVVVASLFSVVGLVSPWSLGHSWYDGIGLACSVLAGGAWLLLYRRFGNGMLAGAAIMAFRVVVSVLPETKTATIARDASHWLGIAGVLAAVAVLRLLTLPAVVRFIVHAFRGSGSHAPDENPSNPP